VFSTWAVGSIPPAGTNDLKELSFDFFVPRSRRVSFWFFRHRFLTHHTMELESYFDDSSDSRRSSLYACGGLLEGADGDTRSPTDCFPIWTILFAQGHIMAYG
jgi:hypothetical protein